MIKGGHLTPEWRKNISKGKKRYYRKLRKIENGHAVKTKRHRRKRLGVLHIELFFERNS